MTLGRLILECFLDLFIRSTALILLVLLIPLFILIALIIWICD